MTVAVPIRPPRFIPSPTSLKRFSVDEYHRMIDAGAFEDDQPVELLEGWIVYQMGHNPPRDVVVKLVAMLLDRALPGHYHTRTQSAITTTDSEPLPDVAVVAGTPRDYLTRHPAAPDIALVVEAADASLDRDRREKAPLYARAGIAVYWIVNLPEYAVEIHTDPTGPDREPRYRATARYGISDAVPLLIPGQPPASIPVKDMLP